MAICARRLLRTWCESSISTCKLSLRKLVRMCGHSSAWRCRRHTARIDRVRAATYFLDEFISDRIARNELRARCSGHRCIGNDRVSRAGTKFPTEGFNRRARVEIRLGASSFLFSGYTLNRLTISAARSGNVARCTRSSFPIGVLARVRFT